MFLGMDKRTQIPDRFRVLIVIVASVEPTYTAFHTYGTVLSDDEPESVAKALASYTKDHNVIDHKVITFPNAKTYNDLIPQAIERNEARIQRIRAEAYKECEDIRQCNNELLALTHHPQHDNGPIQAGDPIAPDVGGTTKRDLEIRQRCVDEAKVIIAAYHTLDGMGAHHFRYDDGEASIIIRSEDDLESQLHSTDEAGLNFTYQGSSCTLYLVYGNSPEEVIANMRAPAELLPEIEEMVAASYPIDELKDPDDLPF